MEFAQGCARISQVMPDVEEDEVRHAAVGKAQAIGVFLAVKPWVGKKVGRDTLGDDFLDATHARAQLDHEAGALRIEAGGNQAVEITIDLAQHRLARTQLPDALDL